MAVGKSALGRHDPFSNHDQCSRVEGVLVRPPQPTRHHSIRLGLLGRKSPTCRAKPAGQPSARSRTNDHPTALAQPTPKSSTVPSAFLGRTLLFRSSRSGMADAMEAADAASGRSERPRRYSSPSPACAARERAARHCLRPLHQEADRRNSDRHSGDGGPLAELSRGLTGLRDSYSTH